MTQLWDYNNLKLVELLPEQWANRECKGGPPLPRREGKEERGGVSLSPQDIAEVEAFASASVMRTVLKTRPKASLSAQSTGREANAASLPEPLSPRQRALPFANQERYLFYLTAWVL